MVNYFISATGTEIGKTFVLTEIINKLKFQNKKIEALKPIITGLDNNNFHESDSAKILSALLRDITFDNVKSISPFYYKAALSPDQAAKLENKEINYDSLVNLCEQFLTNNNENDYNFIEGAGGVYVPINKEKLILDLLMDLNIPIIIVTNNYLGCLSHTLSLLDCLKELNVRLYFNNYPILDNYENNLESLIRFTKVPIYTNIDELIISL
jgi:dethiobiotin synthetase